MEQLLTQRFYRDGFAAGEAWLSANALTLSLATLGQVIVVGLTFLVSRWLAPRVDGELAKVARGRFESQFAVVALALRPLTLPIIWLTLQWLSVLVATEAKLPLQAINLVVSLLTAWVVIRLSASLVRNPAWSNVITMVAWGIAALNILNLLAPTTAVLDSAAINLGSLRLSMLTAIKAVLLLPVLLWLAALASRLIERRITASAILTPSLQVLITKLMKILLVVIAVLAALRAVGIDLTAFAVFTGAIGVGIGFGLQKAVSNFVSGITILLEKSIKPGDVIAVGGTYGRVHSLGARYVTVITRDALEYLIPNDDLVNQQVVNWSYSSEQVRLKLPIGVAYRSDMRKAIGLCLESAGAVTRVLKIPVPVCLMKEFGDNSVNLELRFWIRDPMNGLSNVKSDVMLQIWDRFHANGIEIPFPQRDVHFQSPLEVSINRARPETP